MKLEDQMLDWRFRERGPRPAHPEIAVVGVMASSLDPKLLEKDAANSEAIRLMYENPNWPWPRSIHARAIERILDAGATVVAVDFVFTTPKPEDAELLRVMKKHPGKIVLAATVQPDAQNPEFGNVLAVTSGLRDVLGDGEGFVSYKSSPDGKARRFSSRTSLAKEMEARDGTLEDGVVWWKFAALAAAKHSGKETSHDWRLIDFSGPANTFRPLPVEEMFVENVWTSPLFDGGRVFRGKLVFYGPVAEIFHDIINTPFETMAGVEVHANVAAGILRGSLLDYAPDWIHWPLGAVCVVLVLVVFLTNRNALVHVAGLVAVVVLFLVVTQFAFERQHTVVPTVPGLAIILGTGVGALAFFFAAERWDRAHVRGVLDKYVSKNVAAVVLKNADEFEGALKGEKRAVTVLFSDIRSFTTWSESVPPEQLVGQLNEYFLAMVDHVLASNGTLQKFIGDAILAAWGDTHTTTPAGDAASAVRAALAMRASLVELNKTWEGNPARTVLNSGIGINHGEVVVGEVGHPERMEFTVLGDGVNFAARLESATKQFHTDCLVGESVEALTREEFVYREVGYLRVKGKRKPVHIFIPLSTRGTPAPAWLEDYHRALGLHRGGRFDEAIALFEKVNAAAGGGDFLCEWYLGLAMRYAGEPPGDGWDGSETLAEK